MKEENVYGTRKVVFTLAATLALALAGCGNGGQAQSDASTTEEDEGRHLDVSIKSTEAVDGLQELTPIVAEVPDAPIPFAGSDGQTHLVYELDTTN